MPLATPTQPATPPSAEQPDDGPTPPQASTPTGTAAAKPAARPELGEMAEIMSAFDTVTARLQASHQRLEEEVVRLRRELASRDAQLQRSKRLAALGEMAAGIAHEIRNPLGAIQLYAGMVRDDLAAAATQSRKADRQPLLDSGTQYTARITDAVRHLNTVVQDVLAFAREFEPQPRNVELGQALSRAAQLVEEEAQNAGVTIHIHPTDTNPYPHPDATTTATAHATATATAYAYADPGLLERVLVNLARNAVQAMADHDGPRDLRLTATATPPQATDRQTVITIEDTGPGIPEPALDRLFDPFFTTRDAGTGLGLAIVHRIVDTHGGTITAHNRPADQHQPGGAAFTIRLPQQPDSPLAWADDDRRQRREESSRIHAQHLTHTGGHG